MKREQWVDDTKLLACILVATGHLFMSMVLSGIFGKTAVYDWFIRTIYYFHVPLFFICSGYLYQKKSVVNTVALWKANILGKAVTLGVPFFVFSTATWILKSVFSGSVNIQNKDLLETLFVSPASPYWYLYTLFFIFVIMPTFAGRKSALFGLFAAVALKYIRSAGLLSTNIYAITQTSDQIVWFVLGMCMSVFHIPELCRKKIWKTAGILCGCLFIGVCCLDLEQSATITLVLGTWGCLSVFLMTLHWTPGKNMRYVANILSQYTMPIYLMHTIFAAGIRAVLLKIGISNAWIHVAVGFAASFAGPIIAAEIMKRTVWLEFFLYPGKFIKIGAKQRKIDHV